MADLASGVTTKQAPRFVRRIPTGAILALAMVGLAERGPIGEATLVLDFPEYQASYGGYTANSEATPAVQGFYDNGGSRLYFSRTVHFTDVTNPTTKASVAGTLSLNTAVVGQTQGSVLGSVSGPFDLEPGDDLDIKVNGAGALTATFNATAGDRTSASETYALANNDNLQIKVDGGVTQDEVFLTGEFSDIANATALEVAAVIAAKFTGMSVVEAAGTVVLTSDKRGTGSSVEIVGGAAAAKLGLSGTGSGTGNVADIDAVTGSEVISIVQGAVAGIVVTIESNKVRITTSTGGTGGSVQVVNTSTADDELGLDNAVHAGTDAGAEATLKIDGKTDGAYAGELTVVIAAPTSGDADEFNLTVLRNGLTAEFFPNCSMTDADANYVETVVNSGIEGISPSNLIAVTDLDSAIASPNDVPLAGTFGPLAGGDDGLGGLVDADFTGGTGVNGSTGLRTFDGLEIDVLTIPGRATSAVHNAMITYTDITRSGLIFSILDPPAGQTAAQMVTYVGSTAALFNLTENAAIYWPRVKVSNPSTTVFGNGKTITIAPCGHMAGLYARIDASKIGGAFEQPAGTEVGVLRNVIGLETLEVKNKKKRELVFPVNINPISQEPGSVPGTETQIFVDGARNLDITGNWPSVGQRRGSMFVEKRLIPGLAFIRHQNIKSKLREEAETSVEVFLLSLTGAGAFTSQVPAEAFSVDFGAGLNNANVVAQRKVLGRVGLATTPGAEFVEVEIGPDNSALEAELALLAA